MNPSNRSADGRVRIFNNALKSIKLRHVPGRASIYEESLAKMKVEPATNLPLTQENTFMHNILSSFEKPNRMRVNENEYRFLKHDNEISLSSLNNQSDSSTCLETNKLIFIQPTLHTNDKNELDLCINESQWGSLQEQDKDSSYQVIGKCNPLLSSKQSNACSLSESDHLDSIQETLLKDAYKESDVWLKETRPRALKQLEGDSCDQVDECVSSIQNYQSDLYSCIGNNHLVFIQQTLHKNTKNKCHLSVKENGLVSLQTQGKESSDQVVGNPLDIDSWVENERLASIQETMFMDANNELDLCMKESRLQALQQLGKDSLEQYSSNAYFASPFVMESIGETSPDVIHNLSTYESVNVFPHSSRDSNFSSAENFSRSNITSNGVDKLRKNEKPFLCEELKAQSIQRINFENTYKSPPKNSWSLDKQKDASDERTECVSQNASEKLSCDMFIIKKDQQSDEFLQILNPENSSCSKVENVDCGLFQERCRKQTFKYNNYKTKLPNYDHHALMTLKSTTGFFDSHCHLDLLLNRQAFYGTYADYMAQHKESYPESYKGCIAVFCKPLTFAKKFLWQKHLEQDNVWAAFGCHPKEALDYNDQIEEDLKAALSHHKVKALGEIGLDYSKGNICPKDVQQDVFKRQLMIAKEKQLRLVIHCRDADEDTINIMLEILPRDIIFHLHCFTGNWEIAQRWIGKFPNVFIGITNVVTYTSASPTHEVARRMPLDRLLLETDAPYFVPRLAPEGTCYSHPGMAIHVAAQIAALQKIPVEKVLQWTSSNTKLLYDIH